jgi:hypothetical protein
MSVRTLIALLALAELGCSSETTLVYQSYWIELPSSHTKRDCMHVVKEVRRYALASGYRSEDWQVTGRGERLALSETERDRLTIDFLRRGGNLQRCVRARVKMCLVRSYKAERFHARVEGV